MWCCEESLSLCRVIFCQASWLRPFKAVSQCWDCVSVDLSPHNAACGHAACGCRGDVSGCAPAGLHVCAMAVYIAPIPLLRQSAAQAICSSRANQCFSRPEARAKTPSQHHIAASSNAGTHPVRIRQLRGPTACHLSAAALHTSPHTGPHPCAGVRPFLHLFS